MTRTDEIADEMCTELAKTFNVPETVTIDGLEKSVPLSKREMTIDQFVALSSETPGPSVENVPMPGEGEGEN